MQKLVWHIFARGACANAEAKLVFDLGAKTGDILAEFEWSDFRIILALSRGGSIAGAARILGVDSSTASRRLAAAEEVLGGCLVLRGGREFRFTSEGMIALQAAEAMETSILSAATAIKSAKQSIEGVVRVSCVGSVFHMLVPMFDGLREKYPKLRVEVNDADHIVSLAKGEADIAVRMVRPSEPDLVVRNAFDFGWAVFASKSYAERHGLPARQEELCRHHLILYGEERQHHAGFHWMEQFYSEGGEVTRVNNSSVALRSIQAGVGIGLLPLYEGGNELGLVKVFPDAVYFQTAWLVYHESNRNSARLRVVIDAMIEFFASRAGDFIGRTIPN